MAMSQPRSRPLLLVTEDDEDVRGVLEVVLADRYDVLLAETGEQALQIACERRPDVMLLDWTLPDLSGEEVVRRLRAFGPPFSELPIVIVSGANTLPSLAAEVGAAYCPKPCDVDQLTRTIDDALREARR
jgi:DNA-binding response OmpR family regulator